MTKEEITKECIENLKDLEMLDLVRTRIWINTLKNKETRRSDNE